MREKYNIKYTWPNVVAVGTLALGYLTSCNVIQASPDVNETNNQHPSSETLENFDPTAEIVIPLATIAPTQTPTEIPTQIVEPTLMPTQTSEVLAVNPPNFNQETPNLPHGPFDLIDAHAVYALYRQQEGPSMWTTDTQFITDMEAYSNQLKTQGIELKQATQEGVTHSLLVKDNQILLNFNDESGALTNINPGTWSKDATSTWIDIGGEPELFIGEDDNSYIAKLNQEGQVDAFFNPIGATIDNIDGQWIPVLDGLPNAIWNGKEWSTEIPIRAISYFNIGKENQYGYKYITLDQVKNYETTITPSDLNNQNLGVLLREGIGDPYGIWLVGEIVGTKFGEYTHEEGTATVAELVIDVPDLLRNTVIRYYMMIFQQSHFPRARNLLGYQKGAENLRNEGVDLLAGINDLNLLSTEDTTIGLPFNQTAEYRYETFKNNPDIIGSQFGFQVPNYSRYIKPGDYTFTELPTNYALDVILDTETPYSAKQLTDCFFPVWSIAIDPSIFK